MMKYDNMLFADQDEFVSLVSCSRANYCSYRSGKAYRYFQSKPCALLKTVHFSSTYLLQFTQNCRKLKGGDLYKSSKTKQGQVVCLTFQSHNAIIIKFREFLHPLRFEEQLKMQSLIWW